MCYTRLYKRAAPQTGLKPLWHVGAHAAVFAGPLHHNTPHSHSVPVLLCGLYGAFRLRLDTARWSTCEAAVVPAGVAYEFDMRGEVLAVVYLEPTAGAAATLAPLIKDAREVGGALLGRDGGNAVLRALYEDATATAGAEDVLSGLLNRSVRGARRQLDVRIACGLRVLQAHPSAAIPVADLASETGLSPSRFQHLFAAEVGVPYRRYRGWQRMRAAIREVVQGANLTAAAHAAGFSDQAHFAHDFRRMFGAAAGPSLGNARL